MLGNKGSAQIILPLLLGFVSILGMNKYTDFIKETSLKRKINFTHLEIRNLEKELFYFLSQKDICSLNLNGKVFTGTIPQFSLNTIDYQEEKTTTTLIKPLLIVDSFYNQMKLISIKVFKGDLISNQGYQSYFGKIDFALQKQQKFYKVSFPMYFKTKTSNPNEVEMCHATQLIESGESLEDVLCRITGAGGSPKYVFGNPYHCEVL